MTAIDSDDFDISPPLSPKPHVHLNADSTETDRDT